MGLLAGIAKLRDQNLKDLKAAREGMVGNRGIFPALSFHFWILVNLVGFPGN